MQQEADALMKVSTGRMTEGELKSFVGQISIVQPWGSNGIRIVASINEAAGRTHLIGDYPEHWVDECHDLEGGDDKFGVRPQFGVTLLQAEMNGLSYRNGYEMAWDDVSNELRS